MNPATILIVEDEAIVAHSLKNTLDRLGYHIPAIVASGERAVEKAEELIPDLVLMDIKLKGVMDGVEAAGIIKERLDIPIVYLTAYGDEETLKRAKITEPYGYVLKPVEDRELRCNIEIALHKHQLEKRLRKNHEHLSNIINSIDEVVFSINSEKKITTWNSTVEKLSGFTFDEVKNEEISMIDIFENADELLDIVDAVCTGNPVELDHIMLTSKQGDRKVIQVSPPRVMHEDGKRLSSVVFVGRDVTRQYERLRSLKKGQGYVILDEEEEEALLFLKSVAEMNYHCLVITRNNPSAIRHILHPYPVQIVSLHQNKEGANAFSDLDELYSLITKSCEKHGNATVFLSRIDYLLETFSFDQLLELVYKINDLIRRSSSLFLMNISDRSIFSERQVRLLQSELTKLPGKTLKDFIPDVKLYELLKFLDKEGRRNNEISFKQLKKSFKTSYPTIRKNTKCLEEKEYITIVKKGREKIVYLSPKGKKIIEKIES